VVTSVTSEPVATERTFVADDEVHRDLDADTEALPSITLEIFDGNVPAVTDTSECLCMVEGRVYAFGAPQFETLDEVVKLLEICVEKYAAPEFPHDSVTMFVSLRSIGRVVPFARVDARVDNSHAYATLHFEDGSQQSVRRIPLEASDDVMMLIHRILLRARSESTNPWAAAQ
jgi:hypothetical protein